MAMEPGSWLWWVAAALGAAGLGASLLFVRETQRGGTLPGCGPRSNCQAVSASRWAKVGTMPISALGLGLYGLLLVGVLAALSRALAPVTSLLVGVTAAALLGGALWFTFLQVFVLRRICRFCMIYHGIGLTVGLLILQAQGNSAWISLSIGGAAVVALALLQIIFPGKAHVVLPMPQECLVSTGTADKRALSSGQEPASGASRELVLLGGRLRLSESDWPWLGTPHARRKTALMFDVTCVDCRALYQLLNQAVLSAPERLAVVLIPVPLDRTCNAAVPADTPPSAEACNYVRLFWATWQVDPKIHEDFCRWLLGERVCPAYSHARNWLHQRIGSQLTLALLDASIEMRIQKAVAFYRTMPTDKLPQLALEDRLVVGRVGKIDELWTTLESDAADPPHPSANVTSLPPR